MIIEGLEQAMKGVDDGEVEAGNGGAAENDSLEPELQQFDPAVEIALMIKECEQFTKILDLPQKYPAAEKEDQDAEKLMHEEAVKAAGALTNGLKFRAVVFRLKKRLSTKDEEELFDSIDVMLQRGIIEHEKGAENEDTLHYHTVTERSSQEFTPDLMRCNEEKLRYYKHRMIDARKKLTAATKQVTAADESKWKKTKPAPSKWLDLLPILKKIIINPKGSESARVTPKWKTLKTELNNYIVTKSKYGSKEEKDKTVEDANETTAMVAIEAGGVQIMEYYVALAGGMTTADSRKAEMRSAKQKFAKHDLSMTESTGVHPLIKAIMGVLKKFPSAPPCPPASSREAGVRYMI
jgi:hypothetical protein